MPKFKGGTRPHKIFKKGKTYVNPATYLRITAGPQRDKYVHMLVAEAKIGRRLRADETVEHDNGNGLDCRFENILIVSRPENTRLMAERRKRGRLNAIREWLE
jgi:hypothetical protein